MKHFCLRGFLMCTKQHWDIILKTYNNQTVTPNVVHVCLWWVSRWVSAMNKIHKSTNFACASSRLWSVMVMIWWRMSPMSCFLPSPSVPSCPCGGGSVMPPCTEWPARLTPPMDCMIRAWSSMVDAKESVHWATQIEKLIYEIGYNMCRRREKGGLVVSRRCACEILEKARSTNSRLFVCLFFPFCTKQKEIAKY